MTAGGGSRLLRLTLAVALTAFVLWRVHPAEVVRAAAATDWRWIAAALALVLLDRALMAYRWMVLLCALTPGSRPPFPAVLRIFFVSTFVGSFLPSIAGDMFRAYSLSRLHVSGVEAAASVIMDRALGVLSMVLVAIAALAFAPDMASLPGVRPTIALAGAACAAAAIGLYNTRVASLALVVTSHLPGRKAQALAAGLIDAVRRYGVHHGELTSVLLSSIAVQVLRVLQAWCLGMALGMTASMWAYFVFIPLIVIVMQIGITPSGIGTSQFMFELLFTKAGVTGPQAVALSILFLALGVIGNLPGALLYAGGRTRDEAPVA